MSFLSRLLVPLSTVLALWMSAAHWLFGVGGWLTWWYLPSIGLTYICLHLWVARRINLTRRKGYRLKRATVVSLAISWFCAILFGFTVPNMHDGSLITLFDLAAGEEYRDFAIGLCNTVGILAFAFLGAAIAFAISGSRDPRPEPDESDGPIQMVFPYS